MVKTQSLFFVVFVCIAVNSFAERIDPYLGKKRFVVDIDYVYLKRDSKIQKRCLCKVESSTLPGIDNPDPETGLYPPGKCLFNTRDLLHKQDFKSGVRVGLNYLVDRAATWQLRYLGYFDWKGAKSREYHNQLEFPFKGGVNNTSDWQNANKMKASLQSHFWTIDFNYLRHATPRRIDMFSVSWLLGIRYAQFNEYFKQTTQTDLNTSHYTIDVKNRMPGPQLGGAFEGNLGHNFTWGLRGKIGGLLNFAENDSQFLDQNDTVVLKKYNPSDFNMSFFGEFAPYFFFNLWENVIFNFSYEVLYFSNVALAENQISFEEQLDSVETHVSTGAPLMMHGVFIGLGFTF